MDATIFEELSVLTRRHPLLLLSLLGLLFFADLVLHPTQVLYSDASDMIPLHLPAKHFLVRSWQQTGEVPLWCPYNFGGMPFVHDLQSSAFYPLHLPLYLIDEDCLGAALSWLIVLHVLAAGWCMYGYARSQGLSTNAAFVAGLGYMFAGKWLLHVLGGGHYNMVPLAWLPLVLLWLEQAIHRRSLLRATWAGCAFGLLVLGAYPYVTLYAGLFVALWTLGTALEQAGKLGGQGGPCTWRRTTAAIACWAGLGAWTALTGVALGAVQLLPALQASALASRAVGVVSSAETLIGGLRSLVGLVGPPLTPGQDWIWENRVGLGLLWLVSAVLAPLVCRQGRIRYQAAVCLVLVLFVLGGAGIVQGLPGFRFFQLPSRILLVLALPVALFAGRTMQALFSDLGLDAALRGRCRQLLIKLSSAVLILLGAYAIAVRLKGEELQFHGYWITLAVTLPAAWWLLGPRSGILLRRAELAWMVLLLADLWAIAWPLVKVRPESVIFAPSHCIDYLARHLHEHGRVLDFEPTGHSANGTPLWPGLAMIHEIEPVRGFNPVDILRYKEYLQLITDRDETLHPLDRMFTSAVLGTFPIKNQSLANLLGIRYLVQPSALPLEATVPDREARLAWRKVPEAEDRQPVTFNFIAASASGRDSGLQPLPSYSVYENTCVLPRVFVVPEARALPDRARVLETLKATPFKRRVLLEGFDAHGQQPTSADDSHQATLRAYQPNRVVVNVEGKASGYLVLTDVWFPGWACFVNGHETPIYRADFLFRAVAVPAGSCEVVFIFSPASYRWGKIITAITLLVVVGWSLLALIVRYLRRFRRATSIQPYSQAVRWRAADAQPAT